MPQTPRPVNRCGCAGVSLTTGPEPTYTVVLDADEINAIGQQIEDDRQEVVGLLFAAPRPEMVP